MTAQTPRSSDFPWKIVRFEVFVGLRELLATKQSGASLYVYIIKYRMEQIYGKRITQEK